MSFSVRLDADQIYVDPGDNAPLGIEVTNAGAETDQFEMAVEGLDPEWTAIPVPVFSVGSGTMVSEKVFFQPSRTSESLSAGYPFTIKVRSLESGETRVLPATLHIKPFTHLSMEISPKKGVYSPMVRENVFQVSVINLGNSEQNLQLFGSDPDEELSYTFEPEHISVGPGHQKDADVVATPIHGRPIAGSRLHGFTISARSPDNPSATCGSNAQLEQRPLVTPGSIAIFAAFLILILGWIQFAPKAPTVDVFTAAPKQLNEGDRFTISWQSSNAKSVRITFNNDEVVKAGPPDGSLQLTATDSGTFQITAVRESRQSPSREEAITVKPFIPAGLPVTDQFRLREDEVEPGGKVWATYKVTGATEILLMPFQYKIPIRGSTYSFDAPLEEGSYPCQLIAKNRDGKTVESRIRTLTVRKQPKASIVSLSAVPETIDPAIAKTQIVWQVKRAVRVEMRIGDQFFTSKDATGSWDVDVFKTSDCTLTAYDEDGLKVTKTIKLTVKATTETPPDDSGKATGTTGTTPPPTTTGGDGATTGGGRK